MIGSSGHAGQTKKATVQPHSRVAFDSGKKFCQGAELWEMDLVTYFVWKRKLKSSRLEHTWMYQQGHVAS